MLRHWALRKSMESNPSSIGSKSSNLSSESILSKKPGLSPSSTRPRMRWTTDGPALVYSCVVLGLGSVVSGQWEAEGLWVRARARARVRAGWVSDCLLGDEHLLEVRERCEDGAA